MLTAALPRHFGPNSRWYAQLGHVARLAAAKSSTTVSNLCGTHVKLGISFATSPPSKPAAYTAGAAIRSAMGLEVPVAAPEWVADHLRKIKVVDATFFMPSEQRNAFEEFQSCRIPGAVFFDINAIADPTTTLPHMLPTEEAFSRAASALGLSNDDTIVVYDGKGIFGAARAWWVFRAFGHDAVSVLDGGLPRWNSLSLPLEQQPDEQQNARSRAAHEAVLAAYRGEAHAQGNLPFRASLRRDLLLSKGQVEANIGSREFQVVDARSAGRFQGVEPEPRPGLPSGHIPGTLNVPFPKVLSPEGTLLPAPELEETFWQGGVALTPKQPLAVTCGSGVTACILGLALFRLGHRDIPVYDGSWSEWAADPDTPKAVGST